MKMATYHKQQGNHVYLNGVGNFDLTIGSWLFDWSQKGICDLEGGPGIDPTIRLNGYEQYKPDYDLFPVDYSLGYTWSYCPRKCPFCIVPKQNNPKEHHSIWEFHDSKFKKICLLNNNTFSDPQWKETFEEIWDADLIVRDENGYDLRLLDEEKADALRRTKFEKQIHYAWDQINDEKKIKEGIQCLFKAKIKPYRLMCYMLTGFNTNFEMDMHRFKILTNFGIDPFVMVYNKRKDRKLKDFARWVNKRIYKSCDWENYNP